MEDDLWSETTDIDIDTDNDTDTHTNTNTDTDNDTDTSIGRQHLMEDDLWWKTTFDEGRPLIEALHKTTWTLPKLTWRWTYSALRYFFGIQIIFAPKFRL